MSRYICTGLHRHIAQHNLYTGYAKICRCISTEPLNVLQNILLKGKGNYTNEQTDKYEKKKQFLSYMLLLLLLLVVLLLLC